MIHMEKWDEELEFLNYFPTQRDDTFIAWDTYTFDNLFRLLLKAGYEHEEAMDFMMAFCSFSALVFQERIYSRRYRKLRASDALPPEKAAFRAQFIHDLIA